MLHIISTVLAACNPNDPIGCVSPPPFITQPAIDASGRLVGLISLMNSFLKIVFIVAGLWAFWNIILAGFGFLSAAGNPESIQNAWAKIWQSVVGLLIVVGSFLIAAIIGALLFHDPTAILNPTLK